MTFMIGHCEDSAASKFDATAMHREPEVQDDMAPFACTLTAHLSIRLYLDGALSYLTSFLGYAFVGSVFFVFDVHLPCLFVASDGAQAVASQAALSATLGVARCPCGLAVATGARPFSRLTPRCNVVPFCRGRLGAACA